MTALGVYAGTSPEDTLAFQDWLGRPVDFAMAFLNQSSWAEFDSSIPWATDLWSKVGISVEWSVPLTTWFDGNLEDAATGSYNDHYLNAAQAIAASTAGTDPIYIRTGWEMNGTWFPWSAQDHETAYVGAFHQLVDTFRSVSDRFAFEWTPNVGNDWFVRPADVYPGDDYVDVIGMDVYWNSQWEGSDPVGAWNSLVSRSSGLQWQQDFASAHGKPTAVSEWGTDSANSAAFFQLAGQWFAQHNMLYQSYWNFTGTTFEDKLEHGFSPEAATAFQETFGPLNHSPVAAEFLPLTLRAGTLPVSFDLLQGAYDPDVGDTISVSNLRYSIDGAAFAAAPPAGLIYDAATHRLTIDPRSPAFGQLGDETPLAIEMAFDVIDSFGSAVHRARSIVVLGTEPAPDPGTIMLRVSGDSYEGDPQFIVKVNGEQVGGIRTTHASHAAGEHEEIALHGAFGASPLQVNVEFLNDVYDGASDRDRNLYIEQVSVNGEIHAGAAATNTGGWNTASIAQMFSNGDATFVFESRHAPGELAQQGLVLRISGDSYEGSPQFVVKVDGIQVGDVYTTHAAHAAGEYDEFVVPGNFNTGVGQVALQFINDLSDGTATGDRNLYVEQISLDGHVYAGSSASNTGGWNAEGVAQLFSNGSAVFNFETQQQNTLLLHVAGDSYKGDPQFTVKVDGQQVGGTYSTHASYGADERDVITVQGNFGAHPGQVDVTFVNDMNGGSASADRNLYIDQLILNGKSYAGGTATNNAGWNTPETAQLFSNGTASFHIGTDWHV